MEAYIPVSPQMWNADWKNTAAEKAQNTPAAVARWSLPMWKIAQINLMR
jgi:hypothetical protein